MFHVTVLLFLIMLVLLAGAIRLSLFLFKRAICTVIRLFRRSGALEPEDARTIEELGLRPRLFQFFRDYRPYAFQTLLQAGVIQMREDAALYLSEEKLIQLKGIECR